MSAWCANSAGSRNDRTIFTASTSFANPAVTMARSLSDTFAGIAPAGVAAFIAAQLAGMIAAVILGRWLWRIPDRG
jgi:glycerol uptake facilitator-like aquaporin